jgi:hypothetical protein
VDGELSIAFIFVSKNIWHFMRFLFFQTTHNSAKFFQIFAQCEDFEHECFGDLVDSCSISTL